MAAPSFIDRDPAAIEAQLIALWESIALQPLFPANPVRLLINLIAYRESLLRVGIQFAAEQNLVNYATGTYLDELGELVATPRLAAVPARTTLQFTKIGLSLFSLATIPAGTLVSTASGVTFATDQTLLIQSGTPTGTVTATCVSPGIVGNGFANGLISQFVSAAPTGIQSVANINSSVGGADAETDDRYRTRIKLAPERFSVAGSAGAYRFYTLSVSQTIIDASILQPQRGQVKVYPLLATGAPSSPLIAQIQDALSSDTIRPLTDDVEVLAPTAVNYAISAQITTLSSADQAVVLAEANAAITAYIAERRSKLGNDIVRSEIIKTLFVPGVKDVVLTFPASNIPVGLSQFPFLTGLTITIAGSEAP